LKTYPVWRTRHGNPRYCSDGCVAEATRIRRNAGNADRVRVRSEERAAARADRKCAHCGEPITARRSMKKFCDGVCRMAALHDRATR
jgi:hypothetical protein